MRIFILEDSPERITAFFQMFDGQNITVTNTAISAKTILDNQRFDMIFLDHDLGGQTFVDSECENTGWQIAKHIPKTSNCNTRVLIHSWNSPAASRMNDFLTYSEDFTGRVESKMFGTFDGCILY